jgi:hypothetical protein
MKFLVICALLVFATEHTFAKEKKDRSPSQVSGDVGKTFSLAFDNAASTPGARKPLELGVAPARVSQIFNIVNKKFGKNSDIDLQIRVIVESTGGSTDVSPRKQVYFGIYSENEMSDAIANYSLGRAYEVQSVKRLDGGLYEITGKFADFNKVSKIVINAVKAVKELESLSCEEFSVCTLKSDIVVQKK